MIKDECRKSGMTWKTGKSGGPGEAALRIANAVEQEKALHGPSDEKMKKVAEQAEYNSRTQAAVARIGGWCISVIEGTGDALLLFGQNLRCLLTLSYKKTKVLGALAQDFRAQAKNDYGSVDIQVDDDAQLSSSPDGVWVQAWVFVKWPDTLSKEDGPADSDSFLIEEGR